MEWKPMAVWFEKPPLYIWMMSLFMKSIGTTPLAARFPSAIMGLMTVMMVYFAGKKMFNKTAGFLSAFVLLTTTQFLYYSRAAMTDVTTTFFVTASLLSYLFVRGKRGNLIWLVPGVFAGFAVMTKGVVGLLPFPIIFLCEIYLLVTRQSRFSPRFIGPLSFMLLGWAVVALPWHIYMYRLLGSEFLRQYIGYHVWDRAVTAIEDKGRPFWWYLIVLKVSMRIWFVALLAALPVAVYKATQRGGVYVFLLIWALFVFLFFSIAKSKLVWYVMPLYPALAFLVGAFIDSLIRFVMRRFRKLDNFVFKAAVLFIIFAGSLIYFYFNRQLVYTSDLTGGRGRASEIKR
ncbi:MAG: hypothetical protein KatS3mg101_0345 [Patescibacteria group bacterium]|nr:MAG: hypothetical protein KatS3mg101_0345 [Patescibacteria group bacterium]